MSHANCQILFEAGQALIEKSSLAKYYDKHFVACSNQETFNEYWEEEFHPKFGRYMAWVLFSVGAEGLAKAACVCNRIICKASSKLTLEDYTKAKGPLYELCRNTGIVGEDKDALQKGYKRLKNVRNRDAHSYRENVRSADFPKVEELFVPAFNVVLKAMRCSGHQLP